MLRRHPFPNIESKAMTNEEKKAAPAGWKKNQKVEMMNGNDGKTYNVRILGEKKPPRLTKDEKHAAEIAALKEAHGNQLRIWNRDKQMRDAEADGLRKQVCDLREETHALRETLCKRETLLFQIGRWMNVVDVGAQTALVKLVGKVQGIIIAERETYNHGVDGIVKP